MAAYNPDSTRHWNE